MASPHVAGAAALYLQGSPSASPSAVTSAVLGTATTGVLTGIGNGSPNRLMYSPLTGGGATPPPTECSSTSTGSLAYGGDYDVHPSYTSLASGTHSGCLTGPSGADFDLYLQKSSGSSWSTVARSEGLTSTETIRYSGTAGTYRWVVQSYSGSGSYILKTGRP
jgi:subtilisin family serine protease